MEALSSCRILPVLGRFSPQQLAEAFRVGPETFWGPRETAEDQSSPDTCQHCGPHRPTPRRKCGPLLVSFSPAAGTRHTLGALTQEHYVSPFWRP